MFFKFADGRLYLVNSDGSLGRQVELNSVVEEGGCRLKLKRHRRGYHKGRLFLKDLNGWRGDRPTWTLDDEGYFEIKPGGAYRGVFLDWPPPLETWD